MFKTSIINSICNLPTQVECTTTYLRQKYIREKMNEEQFNLNGWKRFNLKLLLTIILVGISVGKLLENSPSNRTNFFFKYWISIFSFFAKNTFFVRKLFFQTLFLEIHSHEFTITHVALERTGHNDNVNDDDDDDISRWLSTRECRHQTSSSSSLKNDFYCRSEGRMEKMETPDWDEASSGQFNPHLECGENVAWQFLLFVSSFNRLSLSLFLYF